MSRSLGRASVALPLSVTYTSLTAHLGGGGVGGVRRVRDTLAGRQTLGALDANYPRGGCEQKGD